MSGVKHVRVEWTCLYCGCAVVLTGDAAKVSGVESVMCRACAVTYDGLQALRGWKQRRAVDGSFVYWVPDPEAEVA